MKSANWHTMERDVLQAVNELGEIRLGKPASEVLATKYPWG